MATKKPSKTFTSLDDLYGWMQGIFKSQTKKGFVFSPKDKVAANYDIRIIPEPDSADWEAILHCDYSDDFRDVISEQVEIWKPAAIGIVVNYGDKQLFCACRLAEHIDVIDGKPKGNTAMEKREESKRNDLAGLLGNETSAKIAELDKNNLRLEFQNRIDNMQIHHENQLAQKERDIRDLNNKIAELEKKNAELEEENDDLYEERDKLAAEFEKLQESNNSDTKVLAMSVIRDILAARGVQTDGLNGYLSAQGSEQAAPMALPEAPMEQVGQVPQVDDKVMAIAAWYDRLPDITRAEMLEIMKKVELKPLLSHKLLNYIYELARKIKERKQARQNAAQAVPQPAPQPVVSAQPQMPSDEVDEPDEEPEGNYEENDYENDYNEEEENYATTI